MKKHITFALLFAAALTAQAQQGGISGEMLNQIKQSYKATPADKAIRNALGGTSINTLALNQENRADFDTEFSHKVLSKGITDQQSSGRCWLFTGLNVLRSQMIAKYGLDEMEFSQNYCFFYDQLEKANLFLQGIIDTSGSPWTINGGMAVQASLKRWGTIHRSIGYYREIRTGPQECNGGNFQQ